MKLRMSMSRRSKKDRSNRRSESDRVPAYLVKELTDTFRVFDKDGDGKISKDELGTVLRCLGDDLTDSELDEVIRRVDADGDGLIGLHEFISFNTKSSTATSEVSPTTSSRPGGGDSETEDKDALQSAFDMFDIDKNGFISAEELLRVMLSLGEKHTSLRECRHMINCVDKDGDEMVNFSEFQCLMTATFPC